MRTVLDILNSPDTEMRASDKLQAVLCDELIEPAILHEFACRCTERAMARTKTPDARCIRAIQAKRDWLAGETSDCDMEIATEEVSAAAIEAVRDAANTAAMAATWADAGEAARFAAMAATWDAVDGAAVDVERGEQVRILKQLLWEAPQ